MQMKDTRTIAAPVPVVWAALQSPEVLKDAVSGCQELTGNPEDGFEATVVQKVGPVKATFKGVVSFADVVEGQSLTLVGEGKGGAAGFAKGEAHVALRAGPAPQEPDNVVQSFARQDIALYAHRDYIARHGMPEGEDDLANHFFVSHDDPESRAPFSRWLRSRVPADHVVFRSTDSRVLEAAVTEGAGIGFMGCREAALHPELVQVMPPRDEWASPLWLVTHVDLHRTAKVQAFLSHLKAFAGEGSAR